jgi:hypothetical protein
VGLALLDSSSVGTLGVPVWMLVQQRVRVAAVLTYLAAVAAFYWVLGVVLLSGLDAVGGLGGGAAGLAGARPLAWAQLGLGAALVLLSFAVDSTPARERRARRRPGPRRVPRWTRTVVGPEATLGSVAVLAVGAGVVEAASMLPYLGAVGILTTSGVTLAWGALALLGYVVVMITPALLLLGARLLAAGAALRVLARLDGWLQRSTDEVLGWVVGIVGALLALDAAQRLGLLGG